MFILDQVKHSLEPSVNITVVPSDHIFESSQGLWVKFNSPHITQFEVEPTAVVSEMSYNSKPNW